MNNLEICTTGVSSEFLVLERNLNKNGTLEKIGDKIRQIREDQGLTQQELGDTCGCSRAYISKVERAAFSDFSIRLRSYWKILKKVATALHVTISDLLEGVVKTKTN